MSDQRKSSAFDAFKGLAKDLEANGEDPADIADALLVLGINGGARIGGKEAMARFLEDAAVQVRSGITVGTSRH